MIYVAKDRFYPSYNGKIGFVKAILCDGAFDPETPRDPQNTPKTPLPPPPTPPPPPPPPVPTPPPVEPTCIVGMN